MSQLSDETKVVYVAAYYDSNDTMFNESVDFDSEEDALYVAEAVVSEECMSRNAYCYAKIEKRVVPVYK